MLRTIVIISFFACVAYSVWAVAQGEYSWAAPTAATALASGVLLRTTRRNREA